MKPPSAIIIVLIIFIIFAAAYLGLQNTSHIQVIDNPALKSTPTQNQSTKPSDSGNVNVGQVSIEILNPKEEIESEVVLVTTENQPIELRYKLNDQINVPSGYRKSFPKMDWFVSSGTIQETGNTLKWSKSESGLQTVIISGNVELTPTSSGKKITIPFEAAKQFLIPEYVPDISSGMVNGFKVGKYPDPIDPADLKNSSVPETVKKQAKHYQPPKLYYEVTPDTYFKKIYRDYTLGEFDLNPSFSPLTYPRYIALHPGILEKMGLLEDSMRDQGVKLSKFKLIYGFRSPEYNLGAIAEDDDKTLKSPFSMHMYGKAVDFIVDEDDDMRIDDLNQDGDITVEDARTFREYIRKVDMQLLAQQSELVGAGIVYFHHDYYERGEYIQSPYVHMDTRGYVRDDGTLIYLDVSQKIELDKNNPYRLKKPLPKSPFQKMFERLKLQ